MSVLYMRLVGSEGQVGWRVEKKPVVQQVTMTDCMRKAPNSSILGEGSS